MFCIKMSIGNNLNLILYDWKVIGSYLKVLKNENSTNEKVTYDRLAITVVKMPECKRVVSTNVILHYKTQVNL